MKFQEVHSPSLFPEEEASSIVLDAKYRKRLAVSFAASFLLNFFLLWLFVATSFTDLLKVGEKPKPKSKKEASRLVLIQRTQEPLPSKKHVQTFLETDPDQAAKERPKDADFYSEHNTLATQIEKSPVKSNTIPKADGKNTKTMATQNVPLPGSPPHPAISESQDSSQPQQSESPPEKQQASPSTPNAPPKPPVETLKAGDLALLKTPSSSEKSQWDRPQDPNPQKQSPQALPQAPPASSNHSAPPALKTPLGQPTPREVLAQMSKLEGGVPRTGKALAFNSAESPFAAYDKKIIGKIGAYWQYQVTDRYYGESVGEVEISFRLMSDGTITELKVTRNSANNVLAGWCLQAIEQSAPFAPFPESMKALVGHSRTGSITFAY